MTLRRFALLLSLCACGAALASDDKGDLSRLSLEDLLNVKVSSASQLLETARSAPATVYVLTANEISRLGLRDLKDILALIPGVDAIDPHFFLLGGQRGFAGSFSNTLLLINGREMNNLIAGETFISNQFRAGNIQQVEVINGPGSALYGANALGGVINIITKTNAPFDGVEVTTGAGSFRSEEANVIAGTTAGALSLRGSLSTYRTHGNDFSGFLSNTRLASPAAENNAYRRLPDQFGYANDARAMSGSVTADYKALYIGTDFYRNITGRGTSGIQWDYTNGSDQRDLAMIYGGLRREALDHRLKAFAEFRHYNESFRGNHTETEGPIENPITGAVITSGATDSDVETFRGFYSNFAGGGSHKNVFLAQATLTAMPQHTLIAGITTESSHIVTANFARGGAIDPPLNASNSLPEYSNWKRGIYFEDQSKFLGDRLVATIGARYDKHQRYGTAFDPRLGIVYNASKSTTLKLMYGEAFREPNVFEIQNSLGAIRPTKLHTTEAAWNQFLGAHVTNDVVAFRNRARDLIVTDVIAIGGISNKGELHSRGIEDTLTFRSGPLTGFAGLTVTTANLAEADGVAHRVFDIPRVKLNAGAIYEISQTYAIGVTARHHSRSDTEYHGSTIAVPQYTAFDATLTLFRVPWNGSLQLIAKNLLDKTYYQPEPRAPSVVMHPQDGRDVSLRLDFRL
jgi:outer membrane cobalamin receptor